MTTGKIVIPNTRGHYEFDGFEIDIDNRDIVIRPNNRKGRDSSNPRYHHVDDRDDYDRRDDRGDGRRDERRREPEPENMSLLSSVSKIAGAISKKR